MFVNYDSSSVRLTGRWAKTENEAITTTCGSKIEFMFTGRMTIIHFNMEFCEHPYPHLWIQVDDGARTEVTLEKYMRISLDNDGPHKVTVVFKSAMGRQHRWYEPLVAKVVFLGYEADGAPELPAENRRYMEFVGDSIT